MTSNGPSLTLRALLHQEGSPRGSARAGVKALQILSLVFVFLGVVLLNQSLSARSPLVTDNAVEPVALAWQMMLKSARARAPQSLRPTRPFQPNAPMSALQGLALTAIDLNNRANQGYDVSRRASELYKGLSSMEGLSEETVKEAAKAVALKKEDMAGVTAPTGFFDPLGFSMDIPEGKLLFYREVELKHGRVAMLATLGILVGEQFHPLFGGNIDVPSYIAFQETPLQTFWPAVVTAIAIPEVFSVFTFNNPNTFTGQEWTIRSDRVPGDLGFDPLGLKPSDPKEFKEMQTKEINNGRLAMIAAAGMIAQEVASGAKLF